MKFELYCPTQFEVPKAFRDRTYIFGMGKEAALRLAERISKISDDRHCLIFGSAGSLRSDLHPGQVFGITHISGVDYLLPEWPSFHTTVLATADRILKTRQEKQIFLGYHQADLVDMEMKFIANAVPLEARHRLIFIRGIIDRFDDDLSFLNEHGLNPKALLRPTQFIAFLKFLRSWRQYLAGMERALRTITSP